METKHPIELDATYVLRKADPAQRRIITMIVAHIDEEDAVQELGLLQSGGAEPVA